MCARMILGAVSSGAAGPRARPVPGEGPDQVRFKKTMKVARPRGPSKERLQVGPPPAEVTEVTTTTRE